MQLFEPLHPTRTPAGEAGFTHRDAFGPEVPLPAPRAAYLQAALAGEVTVDWVVRGIGLREARRARRRLIKLVRVNGFLPHLASMLTLPPIVIVREPVATVTSQLRQPDWGHPVAGDFASAMERFPDLRGLMSGLEGHPHQMRALAWAIETRCADAAGEERPWIVVHNEELRREPEPTLHAIGEVFGESIPLPADVRKPSRTTFADVPTGIHVDGAMAAEILEIVEAAGVMCCAGGELVAPIELTPR